MRLFYIIYIAIIPLLFFSVNAQPLTIQWQKTFGGTNYDQCESVQQTFDGGFITAGISTSSNGNVTVNHGFGDCWVVKLNSTGTIQWQHSYGGSADDGVFCIRQTSDSGYVIAASSTSNNGDVTGNHGSLDYWIFKLNSAGVLQWQKSLGGSSVDIPYDIHQTSDNGFIVAGYTISNDGDVTGNHGFEDFWIVKLNSTGIIQWQKTFGGAMDERAFSVEQTSDGGYVAAGYTRSTDGNVIGNHGDYDYWIIKLNSTGTLQWQKTLGGTQNDQGHSVTQTSDGGYMIAGFTASTDGDVTFNHGSEDLWMVKLNSTGIIQWQKSLGGSDVDQAYQVHQVPGGYTVAGSSYSLNGDVTGNHGGYDYWIAKTDNSGNLIWEKSLGGSSVEESYAFSPTPGNGYIVAGGTLSNDGNVTGNHGDFDYWLIKLNDVSTPLPVSLVSFEGVNQGAKNILEWTTASEINNDYFELQRKTIDEDFKIIAQVFGHGNSTIVNEYKFDDNDIALNSTYYYRLKQVDYNGDYTYSEIISVSTSEQDISLIAYPNPFQQAIMFEYELKESSEVTLEVFSIDGAKMETLVNKKQFKGSYQQLFSGKTAGDYLARLTTEKQILNIKFSFNP